MRYSELIDYLQHTAQSGESNLFLLHRIETPELLGSKQPKNPESDGDRDIWSAASPAQPPSPPNEPAVSGTSPEDIQTQLRPYDAESRSSMFFLTYQGGSWTLRQYVPFDR